MPFQRLVWPLFLSLTLQLTVSLLSVHERQLAFQFRFMAFRLLSSRTSADSLTELSPLAPLTHWPTIINKYNKTETWNSQNNPPAWAQNILIYLYHINAKKPEAARPKTCDALVPDSLSKPLRPWTSSYTGIHNFLLPFRMQPPITLIPFSIESFV